MSADPATLAWYGANVQRYAAYDWPEDTVRLDRFLDRIPVGGDVLELGCGAGGHAHHMRARGLRVDATDGTPAMVALANARFALDARVMRFEDLASRDAYDAVFANACLIHVARCDLPAMLTAIGAALRRNGWHFASYKLGTGEGRDPLGRLTNFPDRAWIERVYRQAGLHIVESEVFRGEGADGVKRDWIALTSRKVNA